MKVERVLETCLYTEDLTRSATFYLDVLGLELLSRVEERHVFFRCGEAVFLLFDPNRTATPEGMVPPHGARGPGHVAFAVPAADLPRWRAHLADRGVGIEAEVEWPGGGSSIYLRDPSGNSIELTSPRIWGL